MATLNQMVAEQAKVIGEARASLEAAFKKPPTQAATIAARGGDGGRVKDAGRQSR